MADKGKGLLVGGTTASPKEYAKALTSAASDVAKMGALFVALNDDTTEFVNTLKSMEETLGASSSKVTSLISSFEKFAKGLGPALIAQSQYNGFINDLVKSIPLLGPPMAGLMKDQYDAAAAFSAATGTGGEYNESLHDIILATAGLGVGSKETASGMQGLFTTFTDFTQETVEGRKLLGETVIELEALGMSSKNSVPAMQTLRKAFRMSNDDIIDTMLGIEAFADKAGINIQEIASRLSKQLPVFAVYGDNAVSTFKRMELASKSTGLAMDTMLKTVDNFDTFEGATKSVGSLNQMLSGPYLNAIELVQETDPVERMKMLKQAFDDAGVSVQDMSYYQKKAFVDMLPGIGDVTEMTQLLEGDFDKLVGAMDATAKTGKEIQAEAFAQMTPEEVMNEAVEASLRLGNMLPRVEALTATSMGKMVDTLDDLGTWGSNFMNDMLDLFVEEGGPSISSRVRGKDGIDVQELAKMTSGAMLAPVERFVERVDEAIKRLPGVGEEPGTPQSLPSRMIYELGTELGNGFLDVVEARLGQ